MPSPFPGMDPYLEGPLWMGVHGQLLAEIARQLAPRIRPRYVAHMAERVATASVAAAPLKLATVLPENVPHVTVEIRDTQNRQLVTVIEVLSPTNKRGAGREEYLARRGRILQSSAHLVEIDLLREGLRVPMQKPLPARPYFVFLSRAGNRPISEVWPVSLREPLPSVPVPLLAGDPDVPLDLEDALTKVYDLLSYELVVDYGRPPPGTLSSEDAAWAAEKVRKR